MQSCSLSPGLLQFPSLWYICLLDPFLANKNRLAKLVLLNPTLNSTDCLKKLHWLPIHNRIASEALLVSHLYRSSTPRSSFSRAHAAILAGFRTRHITTVAITALCRNVTHSANLYTFPYIESNSNLMNRIKRSHLDIILMQALE